MFQRKLDYYWPRRHQNDEKASLPNATSFLSLPYAARHRIYVLAGLVRFCPIHMNKEGPRSRFQRNPTYPFAEVLAAAEPYFHLPPWACAFEQRKVYGDLHNTTATPVCICPPPPIALFYVCHEISREVSTIFYSENSFIVSRCDEWGFKPLRQLSASASWSLRTLSIRMNRMDCIYGDRMYSGYFKPLRTMQRECGMFSCHSDCKQYDFHDRSIQSGTKQHTPVLLELKSLMVKLAAQCQLEQLRLELVCDVKDLPTAQHVARLLSPLRNLAACCIRLRYRRDWAFALLSQELVYSLTSDATSAQVPPPPRSYHLPPEIIRHILEYSDDLIAPFDLEWCHKRGLVPFDCCTTCTATLDFCACSRFHGAYSQTCTCWKFPLHMFLVSRQVHEIAQEVFYARNRFVLIPRGCRLSGLRASKAALPAAVDMLQSLPPSALPLIRSLAIAMVLPTSTDDGKKKTVCCEWEATVELLATRLDAPKLNLTLFMAHADHWSDYGLYDINVIRQSYRDVVCCLKRLDKLKGLIVHMDWAISSADLEVVDYSAELEADILGVRKSERKRGRVMQGLARIWTNAMSEESRVVAPNGCLLWPPEHYEPAYPERPLLYTRIYSH